MTPEEVQQQMTSLLTNFNTEAAKALLSVAMNGVVYTKERVQEKGVKTDGTSFKGYSVNPLPLYFHEKQATSSQMTRLKQNKKYKKDGLSYLDFRRETGKQVGFKDLTFSGDMWRQTGIVQETSQSGNIQIVVGGLTEEAKQKHAWMTRQQGDYLNLTDQELNLQKQDLQEEIDSIVKKYLLI